MVSPRRGRSSLGCLLTLLAFSAIVYFGIKIGEVYWRAYEFKDAMKQEVRFASQITNERMLIHLRAVADSLDLPEQAQAIEITREPGRIVIQAEYVELVELPLLVREFHFSPRAEASY